MKLIDISTPKHPNTFTMVDDADYEWLNQWKWGLRGGYVVRNGKKIAGRQKAIFMHREILQPPPGMLGDHRFGNKLDHRRENLRICTYVENSRNKRPTAGRILPKGVRWVAKRRRFSARIKINYREITIGYFHTEPEAVDAYNAAAIKYHGEFAYQTPSPAQNHEVT